MSIALGLVCIGLIVTGLGATFVLKALATFKEESLAPEKTIDAIKHNRDRNPAEEHAKELSKELDPKRSPEEIKSQIDSTQGLMKEHVRELRHRLTPAYMGKAFASGVRHHPLRAGVIGAASGLLGFLVVKHRRNHNHNHNHR